MHAMTDVELDICRIQNRLRVAVSDGSSILPAVRDMADAAGGFGLRIIEALTDTWGVDATASGKSVWFTVTRPPRAGWPVRGIG